MWDSYSIMGRSPTRLPNMGVERALDCPTKSLKMVPGGLLWAFAATSRSSSYCSLVEVKEAVMRERIIGLLKEGDASIEEIARAIERSIRHTRRFLDILKHDGVVECYQKGRKWLWRLV